MYEVFGPIDFATFCAGHRSYEEWRSKQSSASHALALAS